MLSAALSITVFAAVALLIGAWTLWQRSGDIKRPLLMLLLAVIAILNVAIWTIPTKSGDAPVKAVEAADEGTR